MQVGASAEFSVEATKVRPMFVVGEEVEFRSGEAWLAGVVASRSLEGRYVVNGAEGSGVVSSEVEWPNLREKPAEEPAVEKEDPGRASGGTSSAVAPSRMSGPRDKAQVKVWLASVRARAPPRHAPSRRAL